MNPCTKVALVKCGSYNPREVQASVDRIFDLLGGFNDLIRPGGTVLLKPNLLSNRAPEKAVTTHPEVVRAVARAVKARGAQPVVADSAMAALRMETIWDQTGFREMCAAEGVPLINLEKSGSQPFEFGGVAYSIARPVLEADAIINIPKLKTHSLMLLTNAVKNMYGVLPGYQKTTLHKEFPRPSQLGAFLAHLYAQVRPALTVCDAVIGMEGNGPAAGDVVPLGFLAGSTDGVALDTAVCHWLKIDERLVPCFGELRRLGAGETDWRALEVVGDAPERFGFRRLRLPGAWMERLIPVWLVRMLGFYVWIRPRFIAARCVHCGLCVKSCPVGALALEPGRVPRLDGRRCIGCCCCHEVCPARAVEMRQSLLLNLARRGKLPS